jgi:hypothetical protein
MEQEAQSGHPTRRSNFSRRPIKPEPTLHGDQILVTMVTSSGNFTDRPAAYPLY